MRLRVTTEPTASEPKLWIARLGSEWDRIIRIFTNPSERALQPPSAGLAREHREQIPRNARLANLSDSNHGDTRPRLGIIRTFRKHRTLQMLLQASFVHAHAHIDDCIECRFGLCLALVQGRMQTTSAVELGPTHHPSKSFGDVFVPGFSAAVVAGNFRRTPHHRARGGAENEDPDSGEVASSS